MNSTTMMNNDLPVGSSRIDWSAGCSNAVADARIEIMDVEQCVAPIEVKRVVNEEHTLVSVGASSRIFSDFGRIGECGHLSLYELKALMHPEHVRCSGSTREGFETFLNDLQVVTTERRALCYRYFMSHGAQICRERRDVHIGVSRCMLSSCLLDFMTLPEVTALVRSGFFPSYKSQLHWLWRGSWDTNMSMEEVSRRWKGVYRSFSPLVAVNADIRDTKRLEVMSAQLREAMLLDIVAQREKARSRELAALRANDIEREVYTACKENLCCRTRRCVQCDRCWSHCECPTFLLKRNGQLQEKLKAGIPTLKIKHCLRCTKKSIWCRLCRDCRRCCACKKGKLQFGFEVKMPDMSRMADAVKDVSRRMDELKGDDTISRAAIGLPLLFTIMYRCRDDWIAVSAALAQYINSIGLIGSLASKAMALFQKMWNWIKSKPWNTVGEIPEEEVLPEVDEALREEGPCEKREGRPSVIDKIMKIFTKRQKAAETLASTSGKGDDAEVQSFGMSSLDMSGWLAWIGGLLTVIFAAVGVKQMPTTKDFTIHMTQFARLGQCFSTVEKAFEIGQGFAKKVEQLFRRYILGEDPALLNHMYEVDVFCNDVAEITNSSFEVLSKMSQKHKIKIDTLLARGDKIMKKLDLLRIPMTERTRLQRAMMILSNFRSIVASNGAEGASMRMAPPVIMLMGDTGSGKSTILWPFFADILARMGVTDARDMHESVYFRYANGASKFWDGYHSRSRICVIDDIFTRRDTEANPNEEVEEAIRMSNNAYWQLPMASLGDKGSTFFNSKVLFWTSNRADYSFQSITNPEAVVNRIKLKFRVRPAMGFGRDVLINGTSVTQLDQVKIRGTLREDPDAFTKMVVFDQLDPVAKGEQMIRKGLTYNQALEIMWDVIQSSMEHFESTSKTLDDYFLRAVNRISAPASDEPPPYMPPPTRELELSDSCLPGTTISIPVQPDNIFCANLTEEQRIQLWDWLLENNKGYVGLYDSDQDVWLKTMSEMPMIGIHKIVVPTFHDNIWIAALSDDELNDLYDLYAKRPGREMTVTKDEWKTLARCGQGSLQMFGLFKYAQETVFAGPQNSKTKSGWFSRWKGKYHYDFPSLVMNNLPRGEGCLPVVEADEIDEDWKNIMYSDCIIVNRELTAEESTQLAHAMLSDSEDRFVSMMSSSTLNASDVCVCPDHRSEVVPTEIQSARIAFEARRLSQESALAWQKRRTVYRKISKQVDWMVLPLAAMVAAMIVYMAAELGISWVTARQEMCLRVARSDIEYSAGSTSAAKYNKNVRIENGHEEDCVSRYQDWKERIQSTLSDMYKSGKEGFKRVFGRAQEEGVLDDDFKCQCKGGEIQSTLDVNAKEIGALAAKNLYRLELKDKGEWVHQMNVLFVKGRVALTNRHLKLLLQNPNQEWRISSMLRGVPYEFKTHELRYVLAPGATGRDLMVIEFPKRVHQHIDITDKFLEKKDLVLGAPGVVCLTGFSGNDPVVRQSYSDRVTFCDTPLAAGDGAGNTVVIREQWRYGAQTEKGECGSPVVAFDKRFPRKIIGIHAGGVSNGPYTGFAQPVTRECVTELLDNLNARFSDSMMSPTLPEGVKELEMKTCGSWVFPSCSMVGNHMEMGSLHSGVHRNLKSRIVPSPIADLLPTPTTAPACLKRTRVGDAVVDPLVLATQKVSQKETVYVDQVKLNRCVRHYSDKIMDLPIAARDLELLSFEETITGVPGDSAYPPINRTSSPGFGWDVAGGKGKTKWLGSEGYILDNPEVVGRFCAADERLKKKQRISSVFIDTLKDERRDLERVKLGKTRLFSAGEMVFTMLFRKYFGGFAAHMHRHRVTVESCVGVNAHGPEWNEIALLMKRKGDRIIAGDFTNYDGSLVPEVLWGVYEVVENFYGDESIERLTLWSEIVNSIHVQGTIVYMWSQSNPSGCPITSLLNSVAHSIMARYVFLTVAPFATLVDFDAHIAHVNYGDDDLWSVGALFAGQVTQATLAEAFKELGMVYTDETKKEVSEEYRSILEVKFLKRSFQYSPTLGFWVAPLNLSTILEIPKWVHNNGDPWDMARDNLVETFRELSRHDRKTWDEHAPVLRGALRYLRTRREIQYYSYDEQRVLNRLQFENAKDDCDAYRQIGPRQEVRDF